MLYLWVFGVVILVLLVVWLSVSTKIAKEQWQRIQKTPHATIVTAYYEMKSKHSTTLYSEWMQNMLSTISNPMVIFCETEVWKEQLLLWRKQYEANTLVVVRPWEAMRCYSHLSYYEKDHLRDREMEKHSPQLYMIWNEKTAMVEKAIELNPFQSEFFVWCDIGAFRNPKLLKHFNEWPTRSFLSTADRDKIYLLQLKPFTPKESTLLADGFTRQFDTFASRIGGGLMLAHKDHWPAWSKAFYDTLDRYMEHDYFCGKDQLVMGSTCILYPELVHLVEYTSASECWFYLQPYFLGLTEKSALSMLEC